MKSLKLAVVVSSVVLMVSGLSQAQESKHNNHQHLSKRPYQEVLPDSAYNKSDNFEGATLIAKEAPNEAGAKNLKAIRLHMLGKIPHMD